MKRNCNLCAYEHNCPFDGDCKDFDAPYALTRDERRFLYGVVIFFAVVDVLLLSFIFIKIF